MIPGFSCQLRVVAFGLSRWPHSKQALTFAARRLQAEGVVILFAARVGEFDAGALPELRLEPLDAVESLLVEPRARLSLRTWQAGLPRQPGASWSA